MVAINRRYRGVPVTPPTTTVHRGLSVVLPGYRLDVVADAAARVATVRVTPVPCPHPACPADVARAAANLAARAVRYLGAGWVARDSVHPAGHCTEI